MWSPGILPAASGEGHEAQEVKEADPLYSQRCYPATLLQRLIVLLETTSVLTMYVLQEPNHSTDCHSLGHPHTSWDANCPSRHFASVGSAETESPQKCSHFSGEPTNPALSCMAGPDKHHLIFGPHCFPSFQAPGKPQAPPQTL